MLGKTVFRYRLKHAPAAFGSRPFVGVAIIGAQMAIDDPRHNGRRVRIGAASEETRVEFCLGIEGSNAFLIRRGKLEAQLYYGFDYSVEADCNATLFELPASR